MLPLHDDGEYLWVRVGGPLGETYDLRLGGPARYAALEAIQLANLSIWCEGVTLPTFNDDRAQALDELLEAEWPDWNAILFGSNN